MRRFGAIATVLLTTGAAHASERGGMLSGGWQPEPEHAERQEPDTSLDPAVAVAFDEDRPPNADRLRTRVYLRVEGGLVSGQHHGDFDSAAYPDVSPFVPPIGVLEPDYVSTDVGFAVGGALGIRVPWSTTAARGATRFEAEYMFRTYTLDQVIYEEDFGLRPEADITGRVTSHAVMGNVLAEWHPDPRWRFGVGAGAGVLFTDLKANGDEGDGSAFAAQLLATADFRMTDHLWLTFGARLLGATEVTYDTDVQEASTFTGDLTVGLALEL